ncbi:3-dehydroquinate synthase [Bacillus sp. AFS076308]|uniref:3-dehydroquinate synthase n=1 Tax=unclassified Bacillus (in: firmicutes) TaxID=185979 RepID=UPI000BF6A719|nr:MULTISPECIES: 3-dehydroquinate synthase [unclassified Bacillus (in: firmicutes)]PFN75803.1 3-dehydroquinate synthase [Bacillus sp. AFS076308]PGV55677.1 3-dehydroquinate synthase [Bacillus sp. AFS037270]
METIQIQTESKEYPVFVGEGCRNELPVFLTNHFPDLTRILIITDETVAKLHLETLLQVLKPWEPIMFTAPAGEKAKTFEVYYDALTTALASRLDRKSVVLSFGGGAVGDLTGFVAASFMRGIPFIQVPTTILAHDSAVGGKVAINHPLGKNMIGAFYQPEAVFYDLELLNTLPIHEIRSGFAEVIKHALIADPHFYDWLRLNIHNLNAITKEQLSASLVQGIKIKNKFVSQDEKETGIRAFLNLGHTLGHAIEAEMGYGNFTHGEAVMIGTIFALKLSNNLLGLSFNISEFIDWVTELGYETTVPKQLSFESLIAKMRQDKKSVGDAIRFVLLEQVGHPLLQEVSEEVLWQELTRF